jgi:hypothetical protein
MLWCQISYIAPGGTSQTIHFIWSPRAGMIPADGLNNVAQREDLRFRDKQSGMSMCARIVTETLRSMNERGLPDIKIEPEAGFSLSCPMPERGSSEASNHLRSLTRIVEALSLAVEDGLVIGHPGTQAEIQPESNCFVAEPDRGFCQNPHDQADGFYE